MGGNRGWTAPKGQAKQLEPGEVEDGSPWARASISLRDTVCLTAAALSSLLSFFSWSYAGDLASSLLCLSFEGTATRASRPVAVPPGDRMALVCPKPHRSS